MLSNVRLLLFSLFLLMVAACSNAADSTPATVSVTVTVSDAMIVGTPTAGPTVDVGAGVVTTTEESSTADTPDATATVLIATAEPTQIVPTPVSPRPIDDGTEIEQPAAEPTTYTIQRGDTFSEIAESFGISTYDLAVYNSIFDPNAIEVGQVIEIPPENVPVDEEAVVLVEPTTELLPEPTIEPTEAAVAVPTESAEEEVAADDAATGEQRTYIVQPGDSLTQLSVDFDVPLLDLALANGLSADSDLVIGQQLIIPGDNAAAVGEDAPTGEPTTYVVQPGDTLREIAIEFGVSEQAILDANNVDDPDRILVGQTLIIPASE